MNNWSLFFSPQNLKEEFNLACWTLTLSVLRYEWGQSSKEFCTCVHWVRNSLKIVFYSNFPSLTFVYLNEHIPSPKSTPIRRKKGERKENNPHLHINAQTNGYGFSIFKKRKNSCRLSEMPKCEAFSPFSHTM